MEIRILSADDAQAFRAIRLEGLCEAPTAFDSSYEEESEQPLDFFLSRASEDEAGAVFGDRRQDELATCRGREGLLYGGQHEGGAADAALRRESREKEEGRAQGKVVITSA